MASVFIAPVSAAGVFALGIIFLCFNALGFMDLAIGAGFMLLSAIGDEADIAPEDMASWAEAALVKPRASTAQAQAAIR